MTRKTKQFQIVDEGRDKGKWFLITEMSASATEAWALRAFMALARSGVDIGDIDPNTGMAGIALLGVRALSGMKYDEAKYLMDEMFSCIQVCPSAQDRAVARGLIEDDIEEFRTRLKLRMEVFSLHTGFSIPGDVLNSK